MLKEFKAFIMTGNVIDLAVAVILAGAVGAVVSSFTNDIMMPIVGEFTGGVDFSQLAIELSAPVGVEGEEGYQPGNYIRYGAWINTLINLLIVGFVLFMIVRAYNKVRLKEEEAPAPDPGPSETDLLKEIRDLLRSQQ